MLRSSRSRRFVPAFDSLSLRIAPSGGSPMDPQVVDGDPPPAQSSNPMDPQVVDNSQTPVQATPSTT